ncbi:MAG: hypothetical protein QG597_1933 [Actinomycetota bacterium]|nr:hypothetical protein [Actinomycetota bacterium]
MIRSTISTATKGDLFNTPSAGTRGLGRRARLLLIAAPVATLALLTGSLITAGPASALDGLHINGTWNVRNTPTGSPNGTVSSGQVVTVDCQTDGPSVTVAGFGTSAIWDHILGRGYISDLAVVETTYARHDPRIPTCGTPQPPTPQPVRWGRTTPTNTGVWGQCVWYILKRFHQATGVYPLSYGDAWNFAKSTGANGWTVSSTPRVRSVAVFQPGTNYAGGYGHVAWVEQVSGNQIQVAEMNYGTGNRVGKESRRWLTPASGVRYVYAP